MQKANGKLRGKVALVTGAARGLGRAHALRLAGLGADVVINDINLESAAEFDEELTAETVMDEVRARGSRSLGIEADVSDRAQVDRMVDEILDTFGALDIVINNAGGLAGHPDRSHASRVPANELRATLERNLMGTIFVCQAAAPHMKERRSGRIVNVSSQAGLKAFDDGFYASYGVAKSGVIAYTRSLAQELAPFGVNVNCIAPAYVETKRLAKNWYDRDGRRERVVAEIPLGRIAAPEDVSKVVEFLITDLSDYVTGQCISICGGVIKF